MTKYHYRAVRGSDGQEIYNGMIDDYLEKGLGAMAAIVRSTLIASHPRAKGLAHDDVHVEMRKADPPSF
ncbi:hypothetical protein [Paracoccus benzoatiresistens]|uniref:Type II secretion system protein GspF domain-containing protein n=1 Tax=Paracoccus benzoatiresistens TaxID=2997341 RepID=A0ABT4JCS5_9RHOB|nr:hypothetical protein [Paracoccus sp. EF6]MCZ0964316.1 hypothetical protein [Paracoccus sp. EF6]